MSMRATALATWILALGLLQPAWGDEPAGPEQVAQPAAAGEEPPAVEALGSGEPTAEPTVEAVNANEPTAAAEAPPKPAAHRVKVDLEVKGELFAPAGRDAEPVRRPIAIEARFDFVERSGTGTAAATRTYAEAAADVRVADEPARLTLSADARRVEVALQGTTPTPYLADGFLSRDELDLLDTPFDAVLLDRLLPPDPVAIDATWAIPPDAAAGLLAIDTIETGGLEAKLTAVDNGRAAVRLTGIVDGAADGAPTHLVVEGDCSLAADPVDGSWRLSAPRVAAVTIRERRQASHVAPGFDVEARVSVVRRPHDDDVPETETATTGQSPTEPPARRRGPGRPGLVWHRDRAADYDLVHDSRWRVVEDAPTGLVLRLIDRGALLGQCSLTALPRGDALAPPTIAEVQRDIERSLAGQFARFEHASEATRTDGVRIVRVVSTGTAENLPFRWIHHVLTDSQGRRAAATFMLESGAAKRFGDADRELIDGLAFPADGAGAADREARVPRDTVTP
jgi:hypothetical protein